MKTILALVFVLFSGIYGIQESFAENKTWYIGEGLNQGDYYSFKLCHFDYKNCTDFQIELWIEGTITVGEEEKWLAQVVVYDGNKIIRGNMELGKIAPEPSGGSSELGVYRGAFKSSLILIAAFATQNNEFETGPINFDSMTFGNLTKQNLFQISGSETITVPAGTFDTLLITWQSIHHLYKIWIVDDFPFPIKGDAIEGDFVSVQKFKFELLDYRENITEDPFIPIAIPEKGNSSGLSLDEKTSDYKTIVIRGKMYENGTTVLDSDWFFTEKEPEIPFDNAGEIRISYYRDGEVVAETGLDYSPFCIVNGAIQCFDFMSLVLGIPYLDDIDKIVFSRSDNVLAEKIVSNNVPQVTVLYPNGGETFMVGQKVTIKWEGNDPDGDDLSYIVAYSRDGGKFWIPTTVDLEETEITGQFYSIDVTDSFSVKVIATDGFNTSFDTSDSTFSVTKYVSPKKQFDAGSTSIICEETFQLIFKVTDNSPACVKPTTAEKLIQRGWARV